MTGLKSVFLILGLTLGGAALGILGSWKYLMEQPLLATKEKQKVVFNALDEAGDPIVDDFEDPVVCKAHVPLDPPVPGLDVFGPPAGVLGGTGVAFLGIFGVLVWRSKKTTGSEI